MLLIAQCQLLVTLPSLTKGPKLGHRFAAKLSQIRAHFGVLLLTGRSGVSNLTNMRYGSIISQHFDHFGPLLPDHMT